MTNTPEQRHRENQEAKERAKENWETDQQLSREQEIRKATIRAQEIKKAEKVEDKKPRGTKSAENIDRFNNKDRIDKS